MHKQCITCRSNTTFTWDGDSRLKRNHSNLSTLQISKMNLQTKISSSMRNHGQNKYLQKMINKVLKVKEKPKIDDETNIIKN